MGNTGTSTSAKTASSGTDKVLECQKTSAGVAIVTLNRPDSLNALNTDLLDALHAIFERLNHDRETRVIILTGAGRGFCSGADMMASAQPGDIPGTQNMGELGFVYRYQEYLARLIETIRGCDKPVIAAVNGVAVGGGLALALASDIRLAAPQARFGAVFIKTGLSACDVGTSYLLPRLVGPGHAAELMLTGRVINAEAALEIGLVNRVVAADDLILEAQRLATEIAANSEYGVWMTKKGLAAGIDAPSLAHAMEMENRTQVLGYFTGCMEAAREAFARGTSPEWPSL